MSAYVYFGLSCAHYRFKSFSLEKEGKKQKNTRNNISRDLFHIENWKKRHAKDFLHNCTVAFQSPRSTLDEFYLTTDIESISD